MFLHVVWYWNHRQWNGRCDYTFDVLLDIFLFLLLATCRHQPACSSAVSTTSSTTKSLAYHVLLDKEFAELYCWLQHQAIGDEAGHPSSIYKPILTTEGWLLQTYLYSERWWCRLWRAALMQSFTNKWLLKWWRNQGHDKNLVDPYFIRGF